MHPNITKCNKTWVLGPLVCIGCVHREKFQRDFVAQTFHSLPEFGSFCTEFSAVTKRSQMHSNNTKCNKTWVLCPMVCIGCVRSEKIRREFVARSFALIASDWPVCIEFNAVTKWSQMHQTLRNATKHEFWVPLCVSRAFIVNSSDAILWHELLH